MFAVIDIETTGGSYKFEKIIEIAIVIHDGEKIVEEFESLINPGILIPFHITRLTGISNEMVEKAPKFFEIAKKIVQITEDKIFVAHNVNFDFGFIRKEFSDLGYTYQRKKLCTVKYSRQVYPGLKSYSLGNLTSHFGIQNNAAHRAMGDAYATTLLLEKLLEKDQQNLFKQSIRKNDVLVNMHSFLDKEIVNALPKKPGVYRFYDKDGLLIYIGKSVNIHQRIIAHLNNDQSARYIEMKDKIADIKYDLTGSDLIAQLLESEMIKEKKPYYNRLLKTESFKFGIYTHYSTDGYLSFSIKKSERHSDALLTFSNKQKARSYIYRLQEAFGICFSDVNTNGQQCIRYLNGSCLGACNSKVDTEEYNNVFKNAINTFLFSQNDFIIELEGRNESEIGFISIVNRKYCGFGFFPLGTKIESQIELKPFYVSNSNNYDCHQIVKSYIFNDQFDKTAILSLTQ